MGDKTTIAKDFIDLGKEGKDRHAPHQAAAEPGPSTSVAKVAARNPLQIIEDDLVNLMKANAKLSDQLEKEREQSYKQMKKVLLSLLPVLDGFDALFYNLKARETDLELQTKLLAGNFRTVRRKLSLSLERAGVVPMEVTLGSLASPFLHEVAETKPAPGVKDGTILEVIQTGYFWNDEIIRHPLVVTAKKSQEGEHG